jgi:hypothetical protein
MKTFNGFDRMSTREELHQVLAVLNNLASGGWAVSDDDEIDAQVPTLYADPAEEDSAEIQSLTEFFMNRPELKN